jgi:hypothetical protein
MSEPSTEHGIRAEIEGQQFTLYVDYDRSRLAALSVDGKLTYFRRRFELVVMNPLAILLEEFDSQKYATDQEAQVLLVWANSLLCGIETLGHFITDPSVSNAAAFLAFVERFMDPGWRERPRTTTSGNVTYGRWLWDSFRNGLAHGAYVKNGGFEKLGDRLFIESDTGLRIDPWGLDTDFRSGVKKMHGTLSDPSVAFRGTFLERFDRTYIRGEN